MKNVLWFSAGVSSFIAGYLLGEAVDEIIYIDIADQHEDSLRFLHDCETFLDKEITMIKSPYGSVENVVKQFKYINGVAGARCTQVLKKRVREEWEYKNPDIKSYIWGYDLDEKKRADRLVEYLDTKEHRFPLIENSLTKQDCHGILANLGIKRPAMYEMGYQNNNCVGCVKGGMGYWNRIRTDFPEVFKSRAKLERLIGASCINGVYLDELEPKRGIFEEDIPRSCGMFCYLAMKD